MEKILKKFMFRFWYWYISLIDKNADVLFMNWGYDHEGDKIALCEKDEKNRYSIQLYHRLASLADLKNKNVAEVGCGRGGGLDYITRTFLPATAMGIDLEHKAVDFGNRQFNVKGLNYRQGNAMDLPIEDSSVDILLNVESSHRYPDMNLFLTNVVRVLKPKGYFLITDFRSQNEMPQLLASFSEFFPKMIHQERINEQVLSGLAKDSERRNNLVRKYIPRFLHKIASNFAGVKGSGIYKKINLGEYEYFIYAFQKD